MKNKYLFSVVVAIWILGSMAVPDPRIVEPQKNVLEAQAKKIINHIEDAKALVYDDYRQSLMDANSSNNAVDTAPIQEVEIEIEDEGYYIAEDSVQESGLIYVGTYEITAYEWTGNPCANGNYPTEGYTVACNDLPFGTRVYIDGVGERVVEDTGGGGYGWMDIYMGDVDACYEWGRQYREVWVVE